MESMKKDLEELQKQADKKREKIEQLKKDGWTSSRAYQFTQNELRKLKFKIDRINGNETSASVDSELSMVLFGLYELYHIEHALLQVEHKIRKELLFLIRRKVIQIILLYDGSDTACLAFHQPVAVPGGLVVIGGIELPL